MESGFSRIAALAGGHAEARAIQVALRIGVFEILSGGPHTAEEVAAHIGCQARATMLLANALCALGLLRKDRATYSLDEAARRYLTRASPEYLGDMILFDAGLWEVWGRLEDSLRSGAPARVPDMFQSSREETARFIRAMDSLVRARGDAVWTAQHLELGFARTIVDLGGGPGTYLLEFLRRWPNARGAIYDLPATLTIAREILTSRAPELMDRIELREVDYRKDRLPGPVDVLFLSNIIHSEDETTNGALMRQCFEGLAPGGLLVVKDHIMDDALVEPAAGAVFALYLLLTTHGRDYSFTEVAAWMRSAGFAEIKLQPLPDPPFSSSLIIARRP
ncbi:MAG TPA: methyltransferase [Candidatus Binataceae bacterium]|nr:methyltransferase [Candidatus Binataceae bacterium]